MRFTTVLCRIEVVLLLVAALLLAALPAVARAQTPLTEITIEQSESGVSAPEQAAAGLVAVTVNNTGPAPGGVTLARPGEGVTMEALMAAVQENPGAALGMLEFVGGPASVAPGGSGRVVMELSEGVHLLLNVLAENPLLGTIEVVAGEGAPAEAPAAGGMVLLQDFAFELPAALAAGAQTWEVRNSEGAQPHEMILFKLLPDRTKEDLFAFFSGQVQGPPPFMPAGGVNALSAGNSNLIDLALEDGNYLAICFIPDPASGKPHYELGMLAEFSIGGAAGQAPGQLPATGGDAPGRNPVLRLVGWLSLATLVGLAVRGWRVRQRLPRL